MYDDPCFSSPWGDMDERVGALEPIRMVRARRGASLLHLVTAISGSLHIVIIVGERLGYPRRGGKLEFKQERHPPLHGASCWASSISFGFDCLCRRFLRLRVISAATAPPKVTAKEIGCMTIASGLPPLASALSVLSFGANGTWSNTCPTSLTNSPSELMTSKN